MTPPLSKKKCSGGEDRRTPPLRRKGSNRSVGQKTLFCPPNETPFATKAPPGLEPGHGGFAIRCLSHLATEPQNLTENIIGKPSIFASDNFPNSSKFNKNSDFDKTCLSETANFADTLY